MILLICLCSAGKSGLRLHCKAIEGSYSRDSVSQFGNSAKWRLGTGQAILAAADIPQAVAWEEQKITPLLTANSIVLHFSEPGTRESLNPTQPQFVLQSTSLLSTHNSYMYVDNSAYCPDFP